MSDVRHIAELVSLGLTFPTIGLALYLLKAWAVPAFKTITKKDKTPQEWFILGVAVGFAGGVVDNGYWFIPWSLSYVGSPYMEPLFLNGVWPNIVFRQLAGSLAAYCHIRAAVGVCDGIDTRHVHAFTAITFAAGLMYVLALAGHRYL